MRRRTIMAAAMFRDDPIHAWLHSDDGEQQVRDAVEHAHPWLVHNTPLSKLDAIAKSALVRRDPGVATTPQTIIKRFGVREPILCLAPPSTHDVWRRLAQHEGPFVKLGVASCDLPGVIGLDWSFDANWNLASVLEDDCGSTNRIGIFLEVVRRRSVLVTYGDIPAASLRIWTKGCAIDRPGEWPDLLNATPDQYETWEVPDL